LLIGSWLTSCGTNEGSEYKNRLANASSPYLQEHADNPVDWYEWGDEALERAQKEGKPLLISVGYASCHWCHVMEAETFMDTTVARIMNDHFISIKVDREERPDIDQIYIDAAQLISGSAGWPLNAFALPDGRPFFAATYFTKDQWIRLLKQVAETYQNDESSLRKQAAAIIKGVRNQDAILLPVDSIPAAPVSSTDIFAHCKPAIDTINGGLVDGPKFPMPAIWEFMLQHHYTTNDPSALTYAEITLDAMRRGGIYDHLRGGFARYATDSTWTIPHFEKMLYDNAQLVKLYAQAYQVTGKREYEVVARETLAFVNAELTSSRGTFYSSINADTERQEGKFYVWSQNEINQALDPTTAKLFSETFNVTAAGNWEANKNVLFKSRASKQSGRTVDESESPESLSNARQTLLTIRNRRVRPSTDDKILTAWNALMIEGYLQAFDAFGDEDYLTAAVEAANHLEKDRMDDNGHLWRIKDKGHTPIEGFLDDYALLCRAFIKLYQGTFDTRYLNRARSIADYAIQNFQDSKTGLFFYSLDTSTHQLVQRIEVNDEVIPSSNAVLAESLFLLSEYYQHQPYFQQYQKMVTAMPAGLLHQGPYYASWARLIGLVESKPFEVAIVGPDAAAKRARLMSSYLPTCILSGGKEENLPLLENKKVEGKTLIYVCRNRVCKFPVERVEQALEQLKGVNH